MDIAFDLGTTFSLVACLERGKLPRLINDAKRRDERRTPSVVLIEGTRASVGWALEQRLEQAPQLPAWRFVKADLAAGREAHRDKEGREWAPEALSALILQKLLKDVASEGPLSIGRARIAVPATFNDSQLQATQLSARVAGLENVDTIPEPIAAAHYYRTLLGNVGGHRRLMIYDFGGGTFDVSVVAVEGDRMRVLANDGHPALGGRLVDDEIMRRVLESASTGVEALSPGEREWLRRVSEEAKIVMSQERLPMFRQDLSLGGRHFGFALVWKEFDRIVTGMVRDSVAVCERCLETAGLDWDQIDTILLTGGSSLFPQVRLELARAANLGSADRIVLRDPNSAVAFGAARSLIYDGADVERAKHELVAGYELSMRMRTSDAEEVKLKTLIARNSPLPSSVTTRFRLSRANQRRLVFQAWQASSPDVPPVALGHRDFQLPPGLKAGELLEFVVTMERSGLVSVRLRRCESGHYIEEVKEFGEGDATEGSPYERRLRDLISSIRVIDY